ncbi:MAG: polysaccharide biosynthesis/export family protein [Pirellulaceae bacterium]|nr:polysaccharide biosynthesis/export family protein [Pirellulaceae bacterium]
MSCGCTTVLSPISSVPASRLPVELLAEPRSNLVPVDLARLRQDAPRDYPLDTGDVLAVYVEGVLGNVDAVPPVHFPERGSDVLPGMGYPVPVREDGCISLPLVEPIDVRGLTVGQAEARIRDVYLQQRQILRPGQDRIVVSMIRKRTYRVIVVREDGLQEAAVPGGTGGRVVSGSAETGRGFVLNLPAYENDVLHALAQSGGLPGLNARNEVQILRGTAENWEGREALIREFHELHSHDRCVCPPPLPDDPAVTRIALRLPPGEFPRFQPRDVILNDGDIVVVQSRETEVFYTGGLLPAGQFPLPRDYDLDVLGAIAVAGRGLGGNPTGGLLGGLGGASPSHLYVIRHTPNGQQVTIGVDLNRAITHPRERLLVQAGDTLILRHTPLEEGANFGLATFFTFGISQLFSN